MRNTKYIFIILPIFLCSCVSVKFAGTKETSPSEKVTLTPPNGPYKETSLQNADLAWQSRNTGNSISYQSICKIETTPLKTIRQNAFVGIEELKIEKEDYFTFNNRSALKTVVKGSMEGIPVKVNLILFKKNACTYHLTYVAINENYGKEEKQFSEFVGKFKVND